MSADHPTVDLVKKLRYDLTAMQGKVSELLRQLGELELPDRREAVCVVCGYRPAMNMPSLAEHAHVEHGAAVPAHWEVSA